MVLREGGMPGRWHTPATLGCCLPEEAVNEVKRQAMSELQKAVSDAERKAHELITTERAKMERALAEAKRQASEDALTVINQQEDSSEVGTLRDALVAVLGCGIYCNPGCSICLRGWEWEERRIPAPGGDAGCGQRWGAWSWMWMQSGMMCMVWDVVHGAE